MKNKCIHCKRSNVSLLISSSHKLKDGKVKRYYSCRRCNTLRMKRYRATVHGYANIKAAIKRYGSKNREKVRVWGVINSHRLAKQPCEECGTRQHVVAPPLQYKLPYQLRWLCRAHDKELHLKSNLA